MKCVLCGHGDPAMMTFEAVEWGVCEDCVIPLVARELRRRACDTPNPARTDAATRHWTVK